MGQNTGRLLHITIGTHPTKELELSQEIRLAKAALLYADRVKLYSLTSSVLGMTSRFSDLPIDHKVMILERSVPLISPGNTSKETIEFLRKYRIISGKKFLTREELALKKQVEFLLNNSWNDIEEATNKIIQNSKILELKKAVDSKVLELHKFENASTDEAVANFMVESITAAINKSSGIKKKTTAQDNKLLMEFVEKVFRTVLDGTTYPLFDEETASMVRARMQITKFSLPEIGLDRGKQAGLIKHLFEYLPTFEEASIDEILDIRKELDKPLTRFRSAIISFSQDIKSAVWDEAFLYEVDKIYYRDIKPAMLDIEDSVKSNKFLTTLVKKVAEKPAVLPIGSLFSVAISQFSSLPTELAASLGIGIASASIIYEAYDKWAKKKQATEQNMLYFYYGAGKRLNK
jgi:hypothetical protein